MITFAGLITLGFFLYILYLVFDWLRNRVDEDEILLQANSILLAYYTQGNEVMQIDSGKQNDFYYTLLLTTTRLEATDVLQSNGGTIIYKVELPFNIHTQLIGITKTAHNSSNFLRDYIVHTNLQEVSLEGDFLNYYWLYSSDAETSLPHYVFDPAAMEFVIDFCTTHNWEIINNELYFTVANDQSAEDIVGNAIKFIEQIKPALVKEHDNNNNNPLNTPYGEYRGKPLLCPICTSEMKYVEHWHECVNGHGRLLHARKLLAAKNNKISLVKPEVPKPTIRATNLVCPFCKSEMHPTQYLKKDLIIDSCTKCAYRWLDAGELAKVSPSSYEQI